MTEFANGFLGWLANILNITSVTGRMHQAKEGCLKTCTTGSQKEGLWYNKYGFLT